MYILTSGIQVAAASVFAGAHELYFRDFLSFSLVGSHPLGRPLVMLSELADGCASALFLTANFCIALDAAVASALRGARVRSLCRASGVINLSVSNRQEKSPETLSAVGHIEWCEAPFDRSNNSRTSCPLGQLNHLFECFPEPMALFFPEHTRFFCAHVYTPRRAVTCRDQRSALLDCFSDTPTVGSPRDLFETTFSHYLGVIRSTLEIRVPIVLVQVWVWCFFYLNTLPTSCEQRDCTIKIIRFLASRLMEFTLISLELHAMNRLYKCLLLRHFFFAHYFQMLPRYTDSLIAGTWTHRRL